MTQLLLSQRAVDETGCGKMCARVRDGSFETKIANTFEAGLVGSTTHVNCSASDSGACNSIGTAISTHSSSFVDIIMVVI